MTAIDTNFNTNMEKTFQGGATCNTRGAPCSAAAVDPPPAVVAKLFNFLPAFHPRGGGHLVHGDPFGSRTPGDRRGRQSQSRGVGAVPIPGWPPVAAYRIEKNTVFLIAVAS